MSASTATRTIWKLDPVHSSVEFRIRHMMVSSAKGRFTGVEGAIEADETNPENSTIAVTIDTSTVDTRDERRDGHLKSPDFLDVANFPTITFRSTSVEAVSSEQLRVVGDLTVHGVTREIVLDTEFGGIGKSPYGMMVAGFSAETEISRKDFGMTFNVALETGGVMLADTVKIAIEAEFVKQG